MLDIKFIRENEDLVKKAVKDRHDDSPIDEILSLDKDRRAKLLELEALRSQKKQAAKAAGADEKAIEAGRRLREDIKSMEETVRGLDERLKALLLEVPNMPQSDVPLGGGEEDNVVERTWGEPKTFGFKPKTHWELGESLGIIDFDRGVKLSGTRFYVLKGAGARLQRALIAFMLDLHTKEHGYSEVYPPYMVKREAMVGSSNLPKFADNLYHDDTDDMWFVPTAEVPLTNMHRDEIIPPGKLPIRYAAYTACFRKEKMSAGKDTRGIKRGHQFDKVELYKFTTPETSSEELAGLLNDAENVCKRLGLPYHILKLCTADLSFASTKSYDIETWAPGCEEWLEISSCSNCTDFQARRANIRYRPSPEEKPRFVHTMNGSGLALPRIMISVIENYQNEDGSITVPEALRDFMGTDTIA